MQVNADLLYCLFSAAIVGVSIYVAFTKKIAVLEVKLDELRKDVNKHNNIIERTYDLESRVDVIETKITDHRD